MDKIWEREVEEAMKEGERKAIYDDSGGGRDQKT